MAYPTIRTALSRRAGARLRAALASESAFPPLPARAARSIGASLPAAAGAGALAPAVKAWVDAAKSSGRTKLGDDFLAMMLNPIDKSLGVRWPDETLQPTALVHLESRVSWDTSALGQFQTGLFVRPMTVTNAGATHTAFANGTMFNPGDFEIAGGWTANLLDYGTPHATWAALSAQDRTVAAGINIRIRGLGESMFFAGGRMYFLRLQDNEINAWDPATPGTLISNEAACLQKVQARQGFNLTLNDIVKSGGVTFPVLPQGTNQFLFAATDAWNTRIPSNFAYTLSTGTGTVATSGIADATGVIIVVGFGIPPTTSIETTYSHHIEYIPRPAAAGLLATSSVEPSVATREGILSRVGRIGERLMGSSKPVDILGFLGGDSTVAVGMRSLAKGAISAFPGGSMAARGAVALSEAAGAPPWLSSALRILT